MIQQIKGYKDQYLKDCSTQLQAESFQSQSDFNHVMSLDGSIIITQLNIKLWRNIDF